MVILLLTLLMGHSSIYLDTYGVDSRIANPHLNVFTCTLHRYLQRSDESSELVLSLDARNELGLHHIKTLFDAVHIDYVLVKGSGVIAFFVKPSQKAMALQRVKAQLPGWIHLLTATSEGSPSPEDSSWTKVPLDLPFRKAITRFDTRTSAVVRQVLTSRAVRKRVKNNPVVQSINYVHHSYLVKPYTRAQGWEIHLTFRDPTEKTLAPITLWIQRLVNGRISVWEI